MLKGEEGGFEFPFQSKNIVKPHVYKELLAEPSGEVMKETSRHFFKIYFYWTINEYYKIKASVVYEGFFSFKGSQHTSGGSL